MLTHTFQHLKGVGPVIENRLWEQNCFTWADALIMPNLPCRRHETTQLREEIKESQQRFTDGDALWFSKKLAANQQWRLFDTFRDTAAYIDIETTGLSWEEAYITSIALWDGKKLQTFVHGKNLDDFIPAINQYSLLVSFNGKIFDIPFIERSFQQRLPIAHLDLRWILKPLGYVGGLKKIEKSFGLSRGALDSIDGRFAIFLWEQYLQTKDPNTLETLLAYNTEDVLTLEPLCIHAFNNYIQDLPFAITPLPIPEITFKNPFTPSHKLINIYRNRYNLF